MDTFTRRYTTGLALLAVLAVGWWVSNLDPRIADLNSLLADDPYLLNYPYQFRVESINGDVAMMTSPRSGKVSVIQALRIMYPELRDVGALSDSMLIAQEDLARHQAYAAKLVVDHPDVSRVHWQLDEQWLSANGVVIP